MRDTSTALSRRAVLKRGATVAGAATLASGPFQALATRAAGAAGGPATAAGYGPLFPVRDQTTGLELLKLPRGFEYLSFGRTGDVMGDGRPTPGAHDGMAAFRMPDGMVHLVRNHELGTGAAIAPGAAFNYDDGARGGNTTLVFDPDAGALVDSWASLSGTIRNCAGGPTPWGSWLSCEETTDVTTVRHGYVFDVPATGVSDGEPIRAMGRFSHEAAAVDPVTGIVYQTEDRTPGGFYRYVPADRTNLAAGGTLQMLKIGDVARQTGPDPTGTDYGVVSWVDIDDPDWAPGAVNTANQGFAKGAAAFKKLEGAWYAGGKVVFVSSSGGPVNEGQVFELDCATDELRIVYASPGAATLNAPDNICVSPRGGMVLCEDGSGQEYLHGLTWDGQIFRLAENNLNESEWAGATFDPKGGNWLFVNIQSPGITFAITGPWKSGAL